MTSLSLFDYLRWLRQHWLITAVFMLLAATTAVLYTQQLPRLYRASVLFTIDPMVYQQGLLRRLDDLVLNNERPSMGKTVTRRPEVRPAFYASSPAFHDKVAEALEPGTDNLFVRQHLHYFRFELDQYHGLQWYAVTPNKARYELQQIMALLSSELTGELISGLQVQLQKLRAWPTAQLTPIMQEQLAQQRAVAEARLQLVSAEDFSLLLNATDIDVSSGPVLPERIWVIFVVLLAWGVVGVTALNFYLLRQRRNGHAT